MWKRLSLYRSKIIKCIFFTVKFSIVTFPDLCFLISETDEYRNRLVCELEIESG